MRGYFFVKFESILIITKGGKMTTFYTCRNDRAFKEVFLNPNNSDLLKALLEFILKIKIDKLEIKKTELLSGNVNVKDKRVYERGM